jgi:hypothetical protein
MKAVLILLAACLPALAAPQSELGERIPVELAHVAQIKQKDPQKILFVRATNADVAAQISKVVLDAQGQRPKFAVLGLYDNVVQNGPQIVVPWEALTINPNHGELFVSASVERLRQAEVVRADRIPDRVPANWGARYYTFYGVEPRDGKPDPNAAGTAALVSGVVKGSGASEPRTPVVDFKRGNAIYLWLGLLLVIFAIIMVSRRQGREPR